MGALSEDGEFLAVHEITERLKGRDIFISENSCASRLPEFARKGLLESRVRPGVNYKEWRMKENLGNNGEPDQPIDDREPDDLNPHNPMTQGALQ